MQSNQTQERIAAQPNTDRQLHQPTQHPMNHPKESGEQLALLGWGVFEASEFGSLWIAWNARGVVCLSFEALDAAFTGGLEKTNLPASIAEPLAKYFDGESDQLQHIPVDPQGTPFQKRVWQALREIPYGEVRSYSGIANEVGSPRGMRAVGSANGKNPVPVIIPCHRVVQADHSLGGYTGGLERKRHLLRLEGARIKDGVVQPGQLPLF